MNSGIFIGILAGLTTGALWGLTFIAPRAVAPFNEYDLAVGRYLTFGLVSVALMIFPAFRPSGISIQDSITAMLLGGAGYIMYFIATAFSVNHAGGAIPPLVIGLMPVILALVGNYTAPAVSTRNLLLPLGLIFIGILIVNIGSLSLIEYTERKSQIIIGTIWAFVALLIWVVYGFVNARVMQRADAPAPLPWAGLQGLGSAIGSIILLIGIGFTGKSYALNKLWDISNDPEWLVFIGWCLVMGIMASWVATWCWSIASTLLPLAICAQLIVAETVFGLIFGFLFEKRLPHVHELIGGTLQITGVMLTLFLFSKPKKHSTS